MVKHLWVPHKAPYLHFDPKRKCTLCERIQSREEVRNFPTIIDSYRWYPLVGRCEGKVGRMNIFFCRKCGDELTVGDGYGICTKCSLNLRSS